MSWTPDESGQGLFHLLIELELLLVIGHRVNREIQIGREVVERRIHHRNGVLRVQLDI
jgi:hypothetical protein